MTVSLAAGVCTITMNYPIQWISNYVVDVQFVAPTYPLAQDNHVTTLTSFTNPGMTPLVLDNTSTNNFRP